VSGNSGSGGSGGGINNRVGGTFNLSNSIVAGNVAATGPDIMNAVVSQGNNLIGNTSGITSGLVASDLQNVASGLDPAGLQNNGGPTQTIALLLGSLAIDAGSNAQVPAGLANDQRGPGFARIVNGTVDIGAFEFQVAPTITSGNATTFTLGTLGSFSVTASGFPSPTFSETGALPAGVTLSPAGVLSGTPASGSVGTYSFAITAANGIGPAAIQNFLLTVNPAATAIGAISIPIVFASPTPQTVVLSAQVTSTAGLVNIGSVTFTVMGNVGASVTAKVDANGKAVASFVLNGGVAPGRFVIVVTYNDPPDFSGSSTTATLIVALPPPVPPVPPVPPPVPPPTPVPPEIAPASVVQVLVASPGSAPTGTTSDQDNSSDQSRSPLIPLSLLLSRLALRLAFTADLSISEIPSEVTFVGQRPPSSRGITTGSIWGTVFEDTNGDGIWQSNELPLEDLVVYLDIGNTGVYDPTKPTATTDSAGHFHFDGLTPGTYTVRVVPHRLYAVTSPVDGFQTVTVSSEGSVPIMFGCKPLRRRQVGQATIPPVVAVPRAADHTEEQKVDKKGRRKKGRSPSSVTASPAAAPPSAADPSAGSAAAALAPTAGPAAAGVQ
jgi:hypothetical protein